jgi:oligogalacturonide lyase
VIFEESGAYKFSAPFISPDKEWVGLPRNENTETLRGPNYQGFKEAFYAVKRALITLVRLDGSRAIDVFEDTHYLGHFQFAPDDSNLAMYCHEGPWNLVQQRIWLLDTAAGHVKPCFRQGESDCVGHEFWTRDGLIFFDNRGPGHDGTITSQRNQATIPDPEDVTGAYIGIAGKDGEVLRTIPMPHYCNHYHANNNNTLLVGDEVDDLVLIDISQGKAILKKLCHHGTSWYNNVSHCHPTFNWEADRILFTSDREGKLNLYLVELV